MGYQSKELKGWDWTNYYYVLYLTQFYINRINVFVALQLSYIPFWDGGMVGF